ncbi:MAG: hypothetical protein O7G85_10910 [Planctomycetota bacterium]|nr:hypothetical protein [Planctomycetota bacterium]
MALPRDHLGHPLGSPDADRPLSSPPETARRNDALFNDIQRLTIERRHQAPGLGESRPEIRNVIEAIDRVTRLQRPSDLHLLHASLNAGIKTGETTCAEAGMLLLSTNHTLYNQENGAMTFLLEGVEGAQQFTFASGTAQSNMVLAFNGFKNTTGVEARVSSIDTTKIEVRSVSRTADAFVRVTQLAGTSPRLYTSFEDETPSFGEIDFGLNGLPGDLDCDGVVGVFDLLEVLQAWGPCAACDQDLDASGDVNVIDLLLLLGWWG